MADKPRTARAGADRRVVRALARWFRDSARDLPWRRLEPASGRRDPYRSLVSEVMLQQTQVSRVVERFDRFMDRFPSIGALALADESDVLAEWSGLGYYRRARMLHRAARTIAEREGGVIPGTAEALAALPGVGRYTAGAIASICFGRPSPIVDGNVRRVLMRLAARPGTGKESESDRWCWDRAGALVEIAARLRPPCPGEFNEGLMELGATVCVPRSPACGRCPLRQECRAHARGLVDQIPASARSVERSVIHQVSVVVVDRRGRLLVERRGPDGLWAGMWQAPSLEGPREASRAAVMTAVGIAPGPVVGRFVHLTTHREVRFSIRQAAATGWEARVLAGLNGGRRWASRAEVAALALSSPQRRILLGTGAASLGGGGAPPRRVS